MSPAIRVLVEITPKKVFVSALDWPGWSRGARDEAAAVEAFLAAAPRYAPVAARAGHPLPAGNVEVDVVERVDGDAGTAFGVPAIVARADRMPVEVPEAARLADLVEAAWATLDEIAAAAPEELRKGPRGGGRDGTKMLAHVAEAEAAYAQVMGRKHRPDDPVALAAMRADLAAVLRQPSDGSPLAGKRWPPRYAARRFAWHVLDHAWEIEDRSPSSV
jgi:hypothetical protein